MAPNIVNGISMQPSLTKDDVVLVNKLVYRLDEPKRYDIIVLEKELEKETLLVKRIIALPGETIEIKDNKIYVNNKELVEFYGVYNGESYEPYNNIEAYTLSNEEYFVMGDNRNNSDDSRDQSIKAINIEQIIGKVTFRIWPFNAIGSMKNQ